jgi:hypothetical protein
VGSFQQIFAYGPGDESDPEPEYTPPAWLPPQAELGQSVPLSVVVARSDQAVVALRSATAYSTGVTFDVVASARGLGQRESNRLLHEQHLLGDDDEPSDWFLRIGFELADGARVSNLARDLRLLRPDVEPAGPILIPHGGGGGSGGRGGVDLQPGYWLWPLPPPGPLRIYVEWPALDIALTHVTLDADAIRDAATRAEALWPDAS